MACEYKDQWEMASAIRSRPSLFPWDALAKCNPPIDPPLYGPPYIVLVRILNKFGHKLPETVSSWYLAHKEDSSEIREICDLIDVCENHTRMNYHKSPDEKVAVAAINILSVRDLIWTHISGKDPVANVRDSNEFQW